MELGAALGVKKSLSMMELNLFSESFDISFFLLPFPEEIGILEYDNSFEKFKGEEKMARKIEEKKRF